MKEIKVVLKKCDHFVFGKIKSMPEELRGKGTIIRDGGFEITSKANPYLHGHSLAVWGWDREVDDYYFGYNYKTTFDAQLAIRTFEKLIKKWNVEHREILDDAEKEYLAAVIKPFKKRVINIYKSKLAFDYEKLEINISSIDIGYKTIEFPKFKKGNMYKGMKTGKGYTLKELGLE